MATFDPGFTPSLSSSGRVDGTSGLTLLVIVVPSAHRPEDDHADQPGGVRAGDAQDDDRDHVVDAAGEQKAEREQRCEDHRAGDSASHSTDQSCG
jgi:hypothetical protein